MKKGAPKHNKTTKKNQQRGQKKPKNPQNPKKKPKQKTQNPHSEMNFLSGEPRIPEKGNVSLCLLSSREGKFEGRGKRQSRLERGSAEGEKCVGNYPASEGQESRKLRPVRAAKGGTEKATKVSIDRTLSSHEKGVRREQEWGS